MCATNGVNRSLIDLWLAIAQSPNAMTHQLWRLQCGWVQSPINVSIFSSKNIAQYIQGGPKSKPVYCRNNFAIYWQPTFINLSLHRIIIMHSWLWGGGKSLLPVSPFSDGDSFHFSPSLQLHFLLLGGELLADRCRTDDLMPSMPFLCLPPSRVDPKVLGPNVLVYHSQPGGSWSTRRSPPIRWWSQRGGSDTVVVLLWS